MRERSWGGKWPIMTRKKKGKLEDKKRENEKIKKKERIRARKKDVSEFRLRGDTFLSKMAF